MCPLCSYNVCDFVFSIRKEILPINNSSATVGMANYGIVKARIPTSYLPQRGLPLTD